MTPIRAGLVLLIIGAVCLTVVALRATATRLGGNAQTYEAELLSLRREAWSIQVEAGRLRAPDHIMDRVRDMRLGVEAPFVDLLSQPSGAARVVAGDR
jgi:hypothetical protein